MVRRMKLCLSCMRKIPLLAGRCPYCIDNNQGVHGRIIILIILILLILLGGIYYLNNNSIDYQLDNVINNLQLMR